MSSEPTERSAPDLDLEPRLRVRRLNRLAVLLAAAVGILVLWVAYYVLSQRAPIAQPQVRLPQPLGEPEEAAIERLRRRALAPRPTPERFSPRLEDPPTVSSAPRRPAPPPDPTIARARQRLARAYESGIAVDGFRAQGREAQSDPATDRLTEWALRAAGAGDGDSPLELAATHPGPSVSGPEAFLHRATQRQSAPILARLRSPSSTFVLQEGTRIPAILTNGIHSDLPGQTTALVRRNVYDTVTGRYLLIPRGSRLVGSYDHRVAWGQKRVLLAWHRLLFPDGASLDLPGMSGTDLAGMAGLRDQVHNHFVRTFGSAFLLSAITAGAQLSQPQESADGGAPSARQITAAALGQELGQVSAEVTRRNLGIQPTLEIRPGVLLHVEVTADLLFPGPYPEDAPRP